MPQDQAKNAETAAPQAPPGRSGAPDDQRNGRAAQAHPEPDDRRPKAPPKAPKIPETNAQKLRALLAWLNYSESASATQLGVSRDMLRGILNETSLPSVEVQDRVFIHSRRWPHGLIEQKDWPKPPRDHRVKE